jgi:uncharacterized lipoprotein NlpE involved in copper resistance
MKKILLAPFLLLVVFLLFSCASLGNRSETQENWAGVYRGMIPAADGPGIDVILILRSNERFVLVYNYIDRGGEDYISSGRLSWNARTNIITLHIDNFPSYYEVGRNSLTQLDLAGRRITGEHAGNYILRKISP